MELVIKVLSILVVGFVGSTVGIQFVKTAWSDYKRRDTVEIRRKGASDSVTISLNGSKQDAKKLVDYVDRAVR